MCERIITATLSTVGHIIEWRPGLAPIAKGDFEFFTFFIEMKRKIETRIFGHFTSYCTGSVRYRWENGHSVMTKSTVHARTGICANLFFFLRGRSFIVGATIHSSGRVVCKTHWRSNIHQRLLQFLQRLCNVGAWPYDASPSHASVLSNQERLRRRHRWPVGSNSPCWFGWLHIAPVNLRYVF